MKKKTILLSILSIIMCLSLTVGGTFALFTSKSEVNVAVTSGTVEISASIDQNSVETKKLYDDAYTTGANNMFGGVATFTDNSLELATFVPGDGIKFNIIVKNTSNVTVKYRTVISCSEDNGLFAGLDVSIAGIENYNGKKYVTNWASLDAGSADMIIPVEIELPELAGDEYQTKTCKINYFVEAVQGNAKTENVSNSEAVDGTATESATLKTNGADSPIVEVPAEVLNDIVANDSTVENVALMHSEPKYDATTKTVTIDTMEIVDQNGDKVDLEAMGNDKEITVTLPAIPELANAKDVYIYHDGEHIATVDADANGVITYTTTHFCEVAVSKSVLSDKMLVHDFDEFSNFLAKAKSDMTFVLQNDVTFTKKVDINAGSHKNKNFTIDLNGYDIDANITADYLFQVYSNSGASLTLTSSKPYARINVGGKSLVLAYGDVNVSNVEVLVDEIKSSSYQTFKMNSADLTIENATINVSFLGTSLIGFNGNGNVTIDGSEINVNEFKTSAGAVISNNAATKVVIKNTSGIIKLNPTYTQYFVIRSADNVTLENNNIAVVDLNGFYYEIERVENDSVGDKYGFKKVGYAVSTADQLVEALDKAATGDYKVVALLNDIKIDPANMSNAYGTTGINVTKGQTIDGKGHVLDIKGAGGTWDSGINTTGGIIRNITVTGSFRGIFINHNSDYSETVVLENVTIDGTVYTISCDQGMNQNLVATNCTFKGWTSFAGTLGDATFTDCKFAEGNGNAYCRPYAETVFENCEFEAGFEMDPRAAVTFEGCTLDGEAITEENLATLVTSNIANAKIA